MQHEYEENVKGGEIFWFNIQAFEHGTATHQPISNLVTFARSIFDRYASALEQNATLENCSLIVNPVNSPNQKWHIDYSFHCSEIFIPLTPLTVRNALQFLPDSKDLTQTRSASFLHNKDDIDFEQITEQFGAVTVSQLTSQPYFIHYLKCGVIHRGIANTGDFDRIMLNLTIRHAPDFMMETAAVANQNTPILPTLPVGS